MNTANSPPKLLGFMGSFNLQDWTRIGAMNWEGAVASASASWSAAVLCRYVNATRWRKRQRTPHSKTWRNIGPVHGKRSRAGCATSFRV